MGLYVLSISLYNARPCLAGRPAAREARCRLRRIRPRRVWRCVFPLRRCSLPSLADPCRADPFLSAAPFPCPSRPVAPPRPAPHHIPALPCPALRRAPSRRSQPATPLISSASPRLSRRSQHRPAAPRIAAPPSSPREVHILTSPALASLAGGSSARRHPSPLGGRSR
jgi:hypothetical protein